MKRNGSKGLAKKNPTRTKSNRRSAHRKDVEASAKEQQQRIARGRQALREAFEIGASFKADAETWKLIAENMTRSKTTIPHAWQTQEVDMSGVVAHRNANKGAFQQREGFSLTFLPYVIAAAVAALREHPQVNATFNDTELLVHRDINIGVSIGLEDTLVVPVIRRADGLSLAGLARGIKPMMYACFSFDHRVLDGLGAARFLVSVRKWLQEVSPDTPLY